MSPSQGANATTDHAADHWPGAACTRARDVQGASGADSAGRALRQVEDALARYTAAVFERTQP
jgi:hypothetical protein